MLLAEMEKEVEDSLGSKSKSSTFYYQLLAFTFPLLILELKLPSSLT